jgi:hypothetical protein
MILENNMSEKQVKVKAIDRWRVVHDGTIGVKGDVLTFRKALRRNGSGAGTWSASAAARADYWSLGGPASNADTQVLNHPGLGWAVMAWS